MYLTILIVIVLTVLAYQDLKERQVDLWLALLFFTLNILKAIFVLPELNFNSIVSTIGINLMLFVAFYATILISMKILKQLRPNLQKYSTLFGEGDALILFSLAIGYGMFTTMTIVLISSFVGIFWAIFAKNKKLPYLLFVLAGFILIVLFWLKI